MGEYMPADRIYGRVFAVTYLVSLPVLATGVICLIAAHGAVWAGVMMGVAVAVLVILANLLKRVDPDLDTGPRRFGQLSGYQIGWYHLVLGAELGRAYRILRTDPASSTYDHPAGGNRPKRRR